MRRANYDKMTVRQIKVLKRKQMQALRKAMDELLWGSWRLPQSAWVNVSEAEDHIHTAHKICKPWWKNS